VKHYQQGKPEVILITREAANHIATMPMIDPDKKRLSDFRVSLYVKMIESGAMRVVSWATAKCIETGETYRVNGQHSSSAYLQASKIPAGSYAIREHYVCDTIEDVAHLWHTFDSQVSVRTNREIVNAFASTNARMSGIGTNVLMLCAGAIQCAKDSGYTMPSKLRRVTTADRAEALLKESDFVQWIDERFSIRSSPHVMRTGPVASMFMTWQKCQRDANTFWTEVRDESNPDNQSASRRVAKWLTQMYARKKSNPSIVREQYIRCLLWWNAFRKNTSTDFRYTASSKTPAVA